MIEFFPKQDVVDCIANALDAVPVEGLRDRARAFRAETACTSLAATDQVPPA
jgi:hypothetical protein